jgi:hypothetical protein
MDPKKVKTMATKKKVTKKKATKKLTEKQAAAVVDNGMEVVNQLVENPPTIEIESAESREMTASIARGAALASDPAFLKYELAKRVSQALANSELVPSDYRGKPNNVFVAINMGQELGMDPFQAIQSIAVIEGKPCLYGDGLIGVVRASPKCLWIEEKISEDGKTATCRTQRDGDPNPIEAEYSMDDAVQAGIHTKFNWKKHPKRMLQMRARAYCLRDAYPDLLKGLGVVEERQDHEDSPPPVTTYALPESKPIGLPLDETKKVFGEGVSEAPTLAIVERAMHQSDTMKELLEAGALAKQLLPDEQSTARITYKKMRNVLMEDAG